MVAHQLLPDSGRMCDSLRTHEIITLYYEKASELHTSGPPAGAIYTIHIPVYTQGNHRKDVKHTNGGCEDSVFVHASFLYYFTYKGKKKIS